MFSEKKGHYTVGKLSKIVSKISRGNVAFELGAELQKILTFTLKRKKKKFKMILKPLPGGSVFFDFLKLKIKINKKKLLIFNDQLKISFAHFGGLTKI